MTDNAFFRASPQPSSVESRQGWRHVLALGVAALVLTGCGGGSGTEETPPAPNPSAPAVPENFTVGSSLIFTWAPTAAATRYELFVDPDGTGPLAEKQSDTQLFSYSLTSDGSLVTGSFGSYANFPEALNASYRLRACNAAGCGSFTDAKAFDITKGISYAFPSGSAPLVQYQNAYRPTGMLSQDELTLVLPAASSNTTMLVFARTGKNQPWQQQASLQPGNYYARQSVLSANGNALAVRSLKQISTSTGTRVVTDAVYVYLRSGSTWNEQARLDTTTAPSTCAQPCQAEIADHMALSADGNLLAVSAVISSGATSSSAVFTYTRAGTTWTPQASLDTEGTSIASMALSANGTTLAVTDRDLLQTATTPLVLVFTQDGNGAWSQQSRIPATLYAYTPPFSGGREYGSMVFSGDGNTLAVNTAQVPGQVACGAPATYSGETQHISLYSRSSDTWSLQGHAVSAAQPLTLWALANDGSALVYGNTLFTRSNGTWACN
jgi:hypothetical protein